MIQVEITVFGYLLGFGIWKKQEPSEEAVGGCEQTEAAGFRVEQTGRTRPGVPEKSGLRLPG